MFPRRPAGKAAMAGQAVGAVMETVAQGDLTRRVELQSQDELGELGRVLNASNEGLRQMVVRIQESAEAIAYVMLRAGDGSCRYGVGRHADILEASLQAVLSSVNRQSEQDPEEAAS